MNLKRLFSITGLSLFAAVSVGAGVALSKPKAAEVKAAGEKWMVTICFDNTNPEESGEWGYIENQKVNFWGTNVSYDDSVQSFHSTGRDHFYTVNVVFESTQSVSGFQLNFTEDGVKKESQDINIALDSTCNGRAYTFTFPKSPTWTDGKWSVEQNGFCTPSASFDGVQKDFTPDPSTASYYIKNYDVSVSSTAYYVNFCPFSYTKHQWDDTYAAIREDASYFSEYFYGWYGEHWIEFKNTSSGTYDFFLTNEFKEGGVIDVKKHVDPDDTYIYYVTASGSATGDYIYSWGGTEQFGAFPGTSIASLVAAEEAEELTGNGVVHFQGGDAKLIYRINVKIGYPVGDTTFMFNNGTSEYKSEERDLKANNAYWWTGGANYNAGQGIQFIELLEVYRNKSADYSVCNISKDEAEFLVDLYNDYDEGIRETYIDCTTVYTWTDASKTVQDMIGVRAIMERLAIIAGVPLEGSSRVPVDSSYATINSTTTIIVVAIALVSLGSIAALVVLKKRRHN